jgi:hypothetical protein
MDEALSLIASLCDIVRRTPGLLLSEREVLDKADQFLDDNGEGDDD